MLLCIKASLRCELTKEENKHVQSELLAGTGCKSTIWPGLSIELRSLVPEGLVCFTKDLGTPCLLCLAVAGLFGLPSTTTIKDLFRGKISLALFKTPEPELGRV